MSEAQAPVLGTADIKTILQLLPHRYPLLLVDRIVEIRGTEFCIGIKNVTANEPQFTGHFPENPVYPGVYIVEGMAQCAGVIVAQSYGEGGARPKNVLFSTIDKCKFRRPVTPGDQLRYELTKIAYKRNIWWYRGEAKVDGRIVAEAELSAMVVM